MITLTLGQMVAFCIAVMLVSGVCTEAAMRWSHDREQKRLWRLVREASADALKGRVTYVAHSVGHADYSQPVKATEPKPGE